MTSRQINAIANEIVKDLFTDGNGETAVRLQLELPGCRNGGGWGRDAARVRIISILTRRMGTKPVAKQQVAISKRR